MIKEILKKVLPKKIVRAIQLSNLHNHMTYAKDGLYTVHNCGFLKDEAFNRAYAAGKQTGSWGGQDLEWRVYTVLWAARKAIHLPGDFVECGVNKGGFSRAIIEYLDFEKSGKTFYLLDTYEGFVDDLLLESEKKKYANKEGYGNTYDEVKKTFQHFSNVRIIKGAVPGTLPEVKSSAIAFLSVDMNCVQPEQAALAFFWPKMTSGGVIILDDFAYAGFESQNNAHSEWARKNNIDILSLPTGQGLIIKP